MRDERGERRERERERQKTQTHVEETDAKKSKPHMAKTPGHSMLSRNPSQVKRRGSQYPRNTKVEINITNAARFHLGLANVPRRRA